MGAYSVSSFGESRPVCFCMPLLDQAAELLEIGEVIDAAERLNEAASLLLEAVCELHEVRPPDERRPWRAVVELLRRRRLIDRETRHWFREVLGYTERASEGYEVSDFAMRLALRITVAMAESEEAIDFPDWSPY